MAKIFISYTRNTLSAVKSLVEDIEALGDSVWFDQSLGGGHAWWDEILAQTRACDVFIFALHPSALESTACKREYQYADALGKPILPVLISEPVSTNLLPLALSRIQQVDYRGRDRNAALALAKAIRGLPPARPLPNPLPGSPEIPVSYLGSLTEKVDVATLSSTEQSSLLIDLKSCLRDPNTADDARTLLKRMRARPDLLARIDREIDELLDSRVKAEQVTSPAPPPTVAQVGSSSRKSPIAAYVLAIGGFLLGGIIGENVWDNASVELEEILMLVVGAASGFVVGTALALLTPSTSGRRPSMASRMLLVATSTGVAAGVWLVLEMLLDGEPFVSGLVCAGIAATWVAIRTFRVKMTSPAPSSG